MMRLIIGLIAVAILYCSCVSPGISKEKPEYTGVDPRAEDIVNYYMRLSAQNHITFTNKVTVGFKEINSGRIVGLCHRNQDFREIDIDINYWNRSSKIQKRILVLHELTHCYCERGHDYGPNKDYKDEFLTSLYRFLDKQYDTDSKNGFFNDGCPLSLMYPQVVDEECAYKHYNHYIKEMFNDCEPY